ncbi:MAG: hypothetical protein U9R38_01825 [Candidatus Margulisiibacteriota bacterium]|nr:hypothetical protein [Candidatus Margulisiibacteriota bacterium]
MNGIGPIKGKPIARILPKRPTRAGGLRRVGIKRGMREDIPLRDFITELVRSFQPQVEREGAMFFANIRGLGEGDGIRMVCSELEDLLHSLISCAIKALETKEGTGKAISLEVRRKGDSIEITLEHNGCGTTLEELSSLGEIVDKNGGKINIANDLGQGTKLTIIFPRQGEARANKGDNELDDNPFHLFIRHFIHACNSPMTGLNYLRMPSVDGVRLARHYFSKMINDFRAIADFIADASEPAFGSQLLSETFLPTSTMSNRDVVKAWGSVPAGERYKIAIVLRLYFEKIDDHLGGINRILSRMTLTPGNIDEVMALHDKIVKVNRSMSSAEYYRSL